MIVSQMRSEETTSIRRLSAAFKLPVSTVGRWAAAGTKTVRVQRHCRISGDLSLRQRIKNLCDQARNRTFGYRRITALLRREGLIINRKTVRKIMSDMGLSRPKIRYKQARPKRVEKMRPAGPNMGWQIDMTSFALSDLTGLYLVIVTDCYSRKIVGWTLDRRCRAGEWVGA